MIIREYTVRIKQLFQSPSILAGVANFNISGNKYRLVAMINYEAQVIAVKQIWTHAEYSLSKNQESLKRGQL